MAKEGLLCGFLLIKILVGAEDAPHLHCQSLSQRQSLLNWPLQHSFSHTWNDRSFAPFHRWKSNWKQPYHDYLFKYIIEIYFYNLQIGLNSLENLARCTQRLTKLASWWSCVVFVDLAWPNWCCSMTLGFLEIGKKVLDIQETAKWEILNRIGKRFSAVQWVLV